MSKKNSLLYSIFTISLISLISKLIGFIREAIVAAYFGTSINMDMFFLANGVIGGAITAIASAIGVAFLPLFLEKKAKKGLAQALKMTNTICLNILVICAVVVSIIFMTSKYIANIIGMEYSYGQITILVKYIRIISITSFFSVIVYLMMSILNGEKKYGITELTGMLYSIVTIIGVVISHKSVDVLAYTLLVSIVIQAFILYVVVYKKQEKIKSRINLRDKNFKRLYIVLFPVVLGNTTLYINQVIDKLIASNLEEGAISALSYSGTLYSFINVLLVASLVTVFFTEFSKCKIEENIEQVKVVWKKGIVILLLMLIPISIICIFFSNEIVTLVLKRGKFNEESVILTASALAFYTIGAPFYGVRNLTIRVFYAFNDTKIPMINGIISAVANILLSIVLANILGIKGITLATSISAIISSILMVRSLKKIVGKIEFGGMWKTIFKIIIATIISVIGVVIFKYTFKEINYLMTLIGGTLVCILVYLLTLMFLKCKELQEAIAIIKIKAQLIFSSR